jgi:steroid 5-alpha reductase family enzyme
VRLIEQSLIDTKPGYREYVRQVSAFLPLPPRRKKP